MKTQRVPMLVAAACTALLVAGMAWGQSPHTHEHSFEGAATWSKVFDDPARDAWQKPHQVIQALSLQPDAKIADIGAGTGYFSTRFARMVPKGRVYAVDTEPDMVKFLGERSAREGLKNIIALQAVPGDARLPEKVDLIVMVDVFHHINDREAYFRKLRDSLKPGGRIALIDFNLDSPDGPPKSARIPPQQMKAELGRAGYTLAAGHGFLPRQYFLVFEPARK